MTHPSGVLAQYDLNDAKAFGFSDLKTAMKNSEFIAYITKKHTDRGDLHTKLDAFTENSKLVQKLSDDNGYFTLVNFAQTNG